MRHKDMFRQVFIQWLPLAAAIFLVTGLACAAVQQNYRMSANDPQIQIAEDVAFAITHGQAAFDAIVPAQPSADMAQSLATFLAVYNATSTPVGSSVALDGKIPPPPYGMFDYVKKHGEFRETWEPKPGLRFAVVVTQYTGQQSGFVLVGRSLREVEIREFNLLMMAGLGGLATWVITFLLMWYLAGMAKLNPALEDETEAPAPPPSL